MCSICPRAHLAARSPPQLRQLGVRAGGALGGRRRGARRPLPQRGGRGHPAAVCSAPRQPWRPVARQRLGGGLRSYCPRKELEQILTRPELALRTRR